MRWGNMEIVIGNTKPEGNAGETIVLRAVSNESHEEIVQRLDKCKDERLKTSKCEIAE